MLEKIKNVFKKDTTKTLETKTPVIPKSRYSFVEQYVITDPNRVRNGGYGHWALCRFTPVMYDNQQPSDYGWWDAVQLPSNWAQPFLKALKNSAPEVRSDPRQRLISVIHLDAKHKMYIVPNLKEKKGSVLLGEHNDEQHKNDWMFYVTPEINRAIVEQAKIRSRG